jgi:Bifunctional DNA primase/polymerase, N-terminal
MGAYAQCAERLIERGFAAVPIMPGTKRPGHFVCGMWIGLANWQRRFNAGPPPESERERWAAGDAGIGVVAGQASHGLIGIDIDSEDPTIRAALTSILPPTPVRKIGARGETLFYHGPDIEQSQSWDIGGRRVVDLIGPGRQTVLPPTIHPDTGVPYRWSGSESLEDLEPHELPTLPADIAERITAALLPFGYRPEPPPHRRGNGGDGDSPHRQLNDEALANLDAWVPALMLYRCRRARRGYEAVPTWRPSTTRRELKKRHLNLKIAPVGIRDFGADQGYTPLDLVMAACGCDLDTAFRFLSERLGWSWDLDLSRLQPSAKSSEAAAKPIAAEASVTPEPPIDELARYTSVPGVVGELVDWITATSRRPNRVLALGAAVSVVGTLIGRRVAGPTRSATHLYAVGIAPTGSGKQHLLDSIIRLLEAAKAGGHIGPSKFFSLSAVLDLLSSKPLVLCPQDEIGVFLKAVTSKRATSHEAAVSQILRGLWGISFTSMPTPAWAQREMQIISCPALSIFGVSTPEEFYAALQGESTVNGFLNRFLALGSNLRATDRDPEANPSHVPAVLSEALQTLYLWSGPESLIQIGKPQCQDPARNPTVGKQGG